MCRTLTSSSLALFLATLSFGCTPPENAASVRSNLTGITGAERGIHFKSYVYVSAKASDDEIKTAIARQAKTAIGALREPMVALNDRGAQNSLDPATWTRLVLNIVAPARPEVVLGQTLRVDFSYNERAAVTDSLAGRSAIDFVMLADDYATHDTVLKSDCTDDPTTETDSLWYHYMPQQSACVSRIQAENTAIQAEAIALGRVPGTVGPKEAGRWFMPITAQLDAPKLPGRQFSPEYNRLFGLGTDKDKLVVYAFFGVNADQTDPDDYLAQEAMKFFRTMLTAQPNFRPVHTDPFEYLLDITVDGTKLTGVTYAQMFHWLLDQTDYPATVAGNATKILALRRQALAKFTERWIYWDLPITVQGSGLTQNLTVEVRSFYGYEDGSADARQHAQWRYQEAFWHGDVFLYNGHSHFGHGPLEPTLYSASNFNDRYQIMLVNSCISFNYYHQDFLNMKPGGAKNLEVVVNGLPSWIDEGGVATAHLLTGLLDGKQHTYVELLNGMRVNVPGYPGYDPMRVVDGELDNVFAQSATPLTLTVGLPVYP